MLRLLQTAAKSTTEAIVILPMSQTTRAKFYAKKSDLVKTPCHGQCARPADRFQFSRSELSSSSIEI